MARNDGDAAHRVSDLFGVAMPAGTGASGTAVAGPETSAGPVVGVVTVTPPYGSSQVGWPSVAVTSGDTCAMSSDSPVPGEGDPLSGVPQAFVQATGAGEGTGHAVHPNSMARRP